MTFTLTRMVTALAMFSLVIVILGGAYVSMTTEYGVEVDTEFHKSYNKIAKTTNMTAELSDILTTSNPGQSNFIIASEAALTTLQIVKNVVLSVPLQMINDIASNPRFPIHPLFVTTLISLIGVVVFLFVISAYLRWGV